MKLSEFTRLLQKVIAEQDYELTTTRFHIDNEGEIIIVENEKLVKEVKKLVVYPTKHNMPRFEYE